MRNYAVLIFVLMYLDLLVKLIITRPVVHILPAECIYGLSLASQIQNSSGVVVRTPSQNGFTHFYTQ